MEKNTTAQLAPLPWYEPESYERVCALMHDKDGLFGTYAEWLGVAQRTKEQLSRKGARTVRVTLDTVRFPAWCAAHRPGQHIDGQARMQYASYIAVQMYLAGRGEAGH